MTRPWRRFWPPGVHEARIALPEDPLSVTLKRNALAHPRRTAIIFYGRELSFAELDDASDRFAGWLRAKGLVPGDRVAIYLENSPQFAIAYMGTLKAGCVNVCLCTVILPPDAAAIIHLIRENLRVLRELVQRYEVPWLDAVERK